MALQAPPRRWPATEQQQQRSAGSPHPTTPTKVVVCRQPAHAIPLHGIVTPRGIERQAFPVRRRTGRG